MGYLTKMNGKSGQNGFSAVGFSIVGQPPRGLWILICLEGASQAVNSRKSFLAFRII